MRTDQSACDPRSRRPEFGLTELVWRSISFHVRFGAGFMKIESREYKLLVDHTLFRNRNEAVEGIWREIRQAAKILPEVKVKGKLEEDASQFVRFLDTPDFTFRRNGLAFRQRWSRNKSEFTLKSRSEDLFMAAGTDVRPGKGLEGNPAKFEEDIAPPFLCRFSHSRTIEGPAGGRDFEPPGGPATVEEAGKLFPVIETLQADERKLNRKVEIRTVQGIVVKETVWKSDTIEIRVEEDDQPMKATFAAILWTRGANDTPVVAELSFRIKTVQGVMSRSAAVGARSLYRTLQGLDCFRSDARTKTEYIYRDGGRD